MTRRILLYSLLVLGLAAVLLVPLKGREKDEGPDPALPVITELKTTEMPLSWFRNIGAGSYMRSAPATAVPEGYDTLFEGVPGRRPRGPFDLDLSGRKVRFLHKGMDRDTLKMFVWPKDGDPTEITRLERGIHAYYIPFGPVKIPGYPKLTVHFYFPTRNIEAWKKRNVRAMWVLPMECLTGEVEVGLRKFKIGLFDRNVNGKYLDPCTQHRSEGDWLLVDKNSDGKFLVYSGGPEVRGITRVLRLGGSYWKLGLEGTQLRLTPTEVQTFRLRVEGLKAPCKLTGWSCLCGDYSRTLGKDGCIELPRSTYRIYTYALEKDGWTLSAAVGSRGIFQAPSSGGASVALGPEFRGELTKYRPERTPNTYAFRVLGRAGETLRIMKGKTRPTPVFVVRSADGSEVFRKNCRFG
jgi:hypothetical protein